MHFLLSDIVFFFLILLFFSFSLRDQSSDSSCLFRRKTFPSIFQYLIQNTHFPGNLIFHLFFRTKFSCKIRLHFSVLIQNSLTLFFSIFEKSFFQYLLEVWTTFGKIYPKQNTNSFLSRFLRKQLQAEYKKAQRISRNLIALYNTTASLNFLGLYPVLFSILFSLYCRLFLCIYNTLLVCCNDISFS